MEIVLFQIQLFLLMLTLVVSFAAYAFVWVLPNTFDFSLIGKLPQNIQDIFGCEACLAGQMSFYLFALLFFDLWFVAIIFFTFCLMSLLNENIFKLYILGIQSIWIVNAVYNMNTIFIPLYILMAIGLARIIRDGH